MGPMEPLEPKAKNKTPEPKTKAKAKTAKPKAKANKKQSNLRVAIMHGVPLAPVNLKQEPLPVVT